jgi:hypothetical protein
MNPKLKVGRVTIWQVYPGAPKYKARIYTCDLEESCRRAKLSRTDTIIFTRIGNPILGNLIRL